MPSLLLKSTASLPRDRSRDTCFYEFDISSADPNKAVLIIEDKAGDIVFEDVISAMLMTYKSDTLSNVYVTLNGVAPYSEHELALHYFVSLQPNLKERVGAATFIQTKQEY